MRLSRHFVCMLALGALAAEALCGTVLKGTIGRDLLLAAKNSPITLDGKVTIPALRTVRLGPGARLQGNEASCLVVEGALRLQGKAKEPVVLVRVAFAAGPASTVAARYCEIEEAAPEIWLSGLGEGRRDFRDCTFRRCMLRSEPGDRLSFTDCQFVGCTLRSNEGAKGATYPAVERCRFSSSTLALQVLVGAKRCQFTDCLFPADAIVHLPPKAVVETCSFCDRTWESLEECLRRASFPEARLIVKRAPPPKD